MKRLSYIWTSEPIKTSEYVRWDLIKQAISDVIKPFLTQFDNITYLKRVFSPSNDIVFQDKYSIDGYNNHVLCVDINNSYSNPNISLKIFKKTNLDDYQSTEFWTKEGMNVISLPLTETQQTINNVSYTTLTLKFYTFAIADKNNNLVCISNFSPTEDYAPRGYVFDQDQDGNNITLSYRMDNETYWQGAYDRDNSYSNVSIYRSTNIAITSNTQCIMQELLIQSAITTGVLTRLTDITNTTFNSQYMRVIIDEEIWVKLCETIFIKDVD